MSRNGGNVIGRAGVQHGYSTEIAAYLPLVKGGKGLKF